MNALLQKDAMPAQARMQPRIGFLGVGWIGCLRLRALAESGAAQIVALADAKPEALDAARVFAPDASCCHSPEALFAQDLDGIVIATPSGAHAVQAIAALKRGLAVFCEKPLTRTAAEAEQVLAAARAADRLLEVDFCYRHVAGVSTLRTMMQSGELGDVYAIDLAFHNAYGPDKRWFYDAHQSGGGCVMDLGTHLIDLAQWVTGSRGCAGLEAQLYERGRRVLGPLETVEDYATATWRLANGACVRMSCSWRLHAGCDCFVEAAFYGTRGGAALRNVGGSFFDFRVERYDGTRTHKLAEPPDAWGGRALVEWAQRIAVGARFDPEAERLLDVARTVDRIYGR